jgi:hypothetical protein
MAVLDLRARFDPEYLTGQLKSAEGCYEGAVSVTGDLDLIGAREFEREHYLNLKQEYDKGEVDLMELLGSMGFPAQPLLQALRPDLFGHDTRSSDLEALRAARIAFAIDYKLCKTLATAERDINRTFRALLATPGDAPTPSLLWWWPHHRAFERWLKSSQFSGRSKSEKAIMRGAFGRNRGRVRTLVAAIAAAGGPEMALKDAKEILTEVSLHPAPWSRQLLTLRTIQGLTCLDILNSRRVVLELAEYDLPDDDQASREGRGLQPGIIRP